MLPGSGIRTTGGVVPVIHVPVEVWSDERMHEMVEDCWCRPTWVFRGDGVVRILHREETDL